MSHINESREWNGRIQNLLSWKVIKWRMSNKVCWNSYIYILDREMVDYFWSENVKNYDWGQVIVPSDMLEYLPWHYGQTYYHQMIDGNIRFIKIGDDYQHCWDKGKEYHEEEIIGNIQYVANKLLEIWNRRSENVKG